ncbi:MAG: hypothetical protein HN728_09470, partial [Flavobacteriales bacterium]|nr:hypothetical protein [Flavobacteriales bacterium]
NDALFTYCAYCGSQLPGVDIEKETDELEELIQQCSTSLGRYEAMVSDYTSLNDARQVDSMSGQPIFGAVFEKTLGDGAVSYSETLGSVRKYLDILEVKASGRGALRPKVQEFKERFSSAQAQEKKTRKKGKKMIIGLVLALILFILFCLMMSKAGF